MVALFVFSTFVVFIALDAIISMVLKPVPAAARQTVPRAILAYPTGLFFSKGHTWAAPAGEKRISVGLGDFIANLVGKIDKIEVASGEIKAGQPLFTIYQGEKSLTLNSPVNGEVAQVNEAVLTDPNLIKERPLSKQWIVTMQIPDPKAELSALQVAKDAKQWIMEEAARFVDSYSRIFAKPGLAPSLADGGTLVEGALAYGDEEAWEKFQQDFL